MPGLHIRDACLADRGAIAAVTLAAYEQYAALMPAMWEVYRESILATLADVYPAQQIVAEQDDAIVGTVLLYPTGPAMTNPEGAAGTPTWPEVRLLAVEPTARKGGIGAALMQECIRRARQSGAAGLTLHTADIMQAAMRLYERLGFQRAPELDLQLGPDVTIKGYRLRLTEPRS
jgi:GNAT superfamily N-acetyltransferase